VPADRRIGASRPKVGLHAPYPEPKAWFTLKPALE